ncbi:hypothetical protein FBU30_000679 [Linnemannia zychae]|nr:hypothetical protein FBU30_000679 [Linnemannia zychae]
MINDKTSSSLENGNPIYQSSSDNLTHQPSNDNFAQFIHMLSNLSPSERQTLASVISPSPPSSKTTIDSHLSSKPTHNKFFNFPNTHELEDYANIKQYHHVQHLKYTAPSLISTKDVEANKYIYK